MFKHVLVPSLFGVVTVGAIAAGGFVMASTTTEPTVANGSARYLAPSEDGAGEFTYTADVRDDSGILSLHVIAWPASGGLDPTEEELQLVDEATCRSTSDETSHCTYELEVAKQEVDELPEGTWYVSVLATANDGDTTFLPEAATFAFTH
ncbi:DUF5707 domain-containing protein [Streptomyces sp. ACA25]|uniref:DUF5707 domain-containing protein n=1 Tax=Streptomyces sp. ACA25 TaxID=3022596 RepID=UPI002306E31B|nr:DUF5707 domain-containing protein [Streptomyces sp. ACA25]MDB1086550.1 DUF5707 domain-containing protein [Streptomyces sp. ACA25]